MPPDRELQPAHPGAAADGSNGRRPRQAARRGAPNEGADAATHDPLAPPAGAGPSASASHDRPDVAAATAAAAVVVAVVVVVPVIQFD